MPNRSPSEEKLTSSRDETVDHLTMDIGQTEITTRVMECETLSSSRRGGR